MRNRLLLSALTVGCTLATAAIGCGDTITYTTQSTVGSGGATSASGGSGGSGAGGTTVQGGASASGGSGAGGTTNVGVNVGGATSCGDGIRDFGEECDGADLGMGSCEALNFDGGVLGCADDCTYDPQNCFVCGDGVANGPEPCDGGDLKGLSCTALGLPPGNLSCAPNCVFDVSGCVDTEDCSNGMDDDGDGFVDCDDQDCLAAPNCQPIEVILGCDPNLCTFTPGAGPNGGDLCVCTIPAGQHPTSDDLPGQVCAVFGNNRPDVLLNIPTAGYGAYSVSTCEANPGDSSLATYDGDPTQGGSLIGCNGDASGESGFCSEIGNSQDSGPAETRPTPASQSLWIQWDAFGNGYWNNNVDRVIHIELVDPSQVEQNCSDGIDNDSDNAIDCADSDCVGDPACSTAVENITGCDPNFCTFTPGAGANGGDLCRCTINGVDHPQADDVQPATSCNFFGNGNDLIITVPSAGYSLFTVTTCSTPGDSSVQVLDAAPPAGAEVACSGDAGGEQSFCSEVGDSGAAGPALPTPAPASQMLTVIVDEFNDGTFWDGMTTRQIDIELLP